VGMIEPDFFKILEQQWVAFAKILRGGSTMLLITSHKPFNTFISKMPKISDSTSMTNFPVKLVPFDL
jgi:hypothetical protein